MVFADCSVFCSPPSSDWRGFRGLLRLRSSLRGSPVGSSKCSSSWPHCNGSCAVVALIVAGSSSFTTQRNRTSNVNTAENRIDSFESVSGVPHWSHDPALLWRHRLSFCRGLFCLLFRQEFQCLLQPDDCVHVAVPQQLVTVLFQIFLRAGNGIPEILLVHGTGFSPQ